MIAKYFPRRTGGALQPWMWKWINIDNYDCKFPSTFSRKANEISRRGKNILLRLGEWHVGSDAIKQFLSGLETQTKAHVASFWLDLTASSLFWASLMEQEISLFAAKVSRLGLWLLSPSLVFLKLKCEESSGWLQLAFLLFRKGRRGGHPKGDQQSQGVDSNWWRLLQLQLVVRRVPDGINHRRIRALLRRKGTGRWQEA